MRVAGDLTGEIFREVYIYIICTYMKSSDFNGCHGNLLLVLLLGNAEHKTWNVGVPTGVYSGTFCKDGRGSGAGLLSCGSRRGKGEPHSLCPEL